MEQGVETGIDNPCIALEDAVEHLQTLFGKLSGAVEVVFFELLLRLQRWGKGARP